MKNLALTFAGGMAVLVLASTTGRATDVSPERLNDVDKLGWFTPGFKSAVHDLVVTKDSLASTGDEAKKLEAQQKPLEKEATAAEAKTIALRQELAKYEHPEETDFVALQAEMKDTSVKLEDKIALAQAYVWTYPASTHEGDAQQYLQQAQATQTNQTQAEKDAEAQRIADNVKLIARARAHDLDLSEWRKFLHDKSEDDLVQLLGRPSSQTDDYWVYSGEYVADATTHRKVGIQINLSAGRVLNVDEIPSPP